MHGNARNRRKTRLSRLSGASPQAGEVRLRTQVVTGVFPYLCAEQRLYCYVIQQNHMALAGSFHSFTAEHPRMRLDLHEELNCHLPFCS